MSAVDLRIGDAEREAAAERLAAAFAAGRLDADEHAERLDAVWSAKVGRDLDALFWDLPAEGGPTRGPDAGPRAGDRRRRGPRPPVLLVVAALIVLSALTHLPFWLGIFLVLGPRWHRAGRERRAVAPGAWGHGTCSIGSRNP